LPQRGGGIAAGGDRARGGGGPDERAGDVRLERIFGQKYGPHLSSKNRFLSPDAMQDDLMACLKDSKSPLLKSLFADKEGAGRSKKKITVGGFFKVRHFF
jgi:hypothetical protein